MPSTRTHLGANTANGDFTKQIKRSRLSLKRTFEAEPSTSKTDASHDSKSLKSEDSMDTIDSDIISNSSKEEFSIKNPITSSNQGKQMSSLMDYAFHKKMSPKRAKEGTPKRTRLSLKSVGEKTQHTESEEGSQDEDNMTSKFFIRDKKTEKPIAVGVLKPFNKDTDAKCKEDESVKDKNKSEDKQQVPEVFSTKQKKKHSGKHKKKTDKVQGVESSHKEQQRIEKKLKEEVSCSSSPPKGEGPLVNVVSGLVKSINVQCAPTPSKEQAKKAEKRERSASKDAPAPALKRAKTSRKTGEAEKQPKEKKRDNVKKDKPTAAEELPAKRGSKKAEKQVKTEAAAYKVPSGKKEKKTDPKRSSKRTAATKVVPDQPEAKVPRKDKEEKEEEVVPVYSNLSEKKNSNGEEGKLKIMSWNVAGLRAAVKKGAVEYFLRENADIVCLQEVRCSDKDIPAAIMDIDDYYMFWTESKSKASYAGCGLWSKVKPINVTYGIGDAAYDDEGRAITAEYGDFYVVSLYVPNSGRKLVNLVKRLEWNEAFNKYILKLDARKPVVIAGDMNVAHKEIDLANPKSNTKNAGFTKEERTAMTEFLDQGFVDTFRNFYPDLKGQYTFWTYIGKARTRNVGWRLDYILSSSRIIEKICGSEIRSDVLGSDHCPIVAWLGK